MMRLKFWEKAPEKAARVEPVMVEPLPQVKPLRATGIQRRNWLAANTPLIQGWASMPVHIDAMILREHQKLVARSREQAVNNPYFKRFFALMRSNIIGPNGIGFQSMCVNDRGEADTADRIVIEKGYKEWCKAEFSDFKQRVNWKDKQRLIIDGIARDGEAFLRHHLDTENKFGYSNSLIDPVLLPIDHNVAELRNGNYIRFSIEFDKRDRPVFYYVLTTSKVTYDYQHGTRNFIKIPAAEVTHIFLPEWIDQKRGIPWGATALMRAKMLDGYEEAALVAARAGAAKMGFLRDSGDIVDEYVGDAQDDQGNHISTIEAGTIEDIGSKEFVSFDPKYPDAQFEIFVKQILRGISAGLGLSYYVLANDLEGVNYTSSRTGALEDRELYKALQDFIIENICTPVVERVISFGLLKKAFVNAAGLGLPVSKTEKFQVVKFQGRRWQWVDPLKDYQAATTAIDAKLASRAQVIREMGRDPDEVWSELEYEAKRFGSTAPDTTGNAPKPASKQTTTTVDEENPATEAESDDAED